jgi:hypothetical protein
VDTEMLSESELDCRLRKANPVNRAALDDDGVLAGLASVRRSVVSGAHRQAPSRLTVRPVYRRRWATLGAATAVVAAASLVGVETLTGGAGGAGLPLAVSPAAAAQLGRVAHAAAGQATPGASQLEYRVYRSEIAADPSVGDVRVGFTSGETVQDWDGPIPGGARRERITNDGISFASPQDQANYLANKSAFDAELATTFGDLVGAPPAHDPMAKGMLYDHLFPPRGSQQDGANFTQIQKAVLAGTERPSGPQELLHDLSLSLDAQPGDLWSGLVTILRDSTDAQLRATAYEALAYVPGATVLGDVKDQLGRVGVAIHFTGYVKGPTDTLIVSPSTGYLLEDDVTLQTPKGTVLQREVDLQRGIVNSVTALPGGGSQPLTTATKTVNLATGTMTPTLQATTPASSTTTSTPQNTTSTPQNTTSTPQNTTSASQSTTSTPQATTPQTTTSTPQS